MEEGNTVSRKLHEGTMSASTAAAFNITPLGQPMTAPPVGYAGGWWLRMSCAGTLRR